MPNITQLEDTEREPVIKCLGCLVLFRYRYSLGVSNVLYQNWKATLVHFSDIVTVELNEKYKNSRSDDFTRHNKIGAKPLLSTYL